MTIVNPAITGTIVISGLWGSGKSTLGMTLEDPRLVTMLDLDQKSKGRAEALGMTYLSPNVDISSPEDYDREAILRWSQTTFGGLREKYAGQTTLFIDNGSYLEDAWHLAVLKDPAKYGVNPENARNGRYGGTNPGVSRIWQNTIAYLTGIGYQRLIVAMHMSELWAGGAPVEKFKVKGNKVLTQLSNLSLVLIKSNIPNQPPRAIVGKEALGLIRFVDGEFKTFMALPPAIPICTWKHINQYIDTAPEREEFAKEEIPTKQEMERYGPWFSKEQKELVMTVAKNPNFGVTEEEAAAVVSGNEPTFNSWEEVKQALVRDLGLPSMEAAKQAMGKIYKEGMSFADAYNATVRNHQG